MVGAVYGALSGGADRQAMRLLCGGHWSLLTLGEPAAAGGCTAEVASQGSAIVLSLLVLLYGLAACLPVGTGNFTVPHTNHTPLALSQFLKCPACIQHYR